MEALPPFVNLIPQNKELNAFDGFITVGNKDYRISISGGKLESSSLYLDWPLQYLDEDKNILKQRLDKSQDLNTFLSELHSVLERNVKSTASTVQVPSAYYKKLITEIGDLGWDKISYINDDLTEIHLNAKDPALREHILQLKISAQGSNNLFKVLDDLPIAFKVPNNQNWSLKIIYQEFVKTILKYQIFWNEMEVLDKNTWILEPKKPLKKDTSRRIVLNQCLSIQITVNPLKVNSIPECCFLGSDEAVAQIREMFNTNIDKWDLNNSLLENLIMLGLDFPLPDSNKNEDNTMQCGICYSYQLNDLITDKTCDNKSCKQPFHSQCLFEWLQTLPTRRQTFNIIFGECPYCTKPLTCKIPHASHLM